MHLWIVKGDKQTMSTEWLRVIELGLQLGGHVTEKMIHSACRDLAITLLKCGKFVPTDLNIVCKLIWRKCIGLVYIWTSRRSLQLLWCQLPKIGPMLPVLAKLISRISYLAFFHRVLHLYIIPAAIPRNCNRNNTILNVCNSKKCYHLLHHNSCHRLKMYYQS